MDDNAILTEVESCWTILADAIGAGRRDLTPQRIEAIEADARWLVELLVFLRMAQQRRLLPAGILGHFESASRSGERLADSVRRLEGELGAGLVRIESATPGSGRSDPRPARIEKDWFTQVARRFDQTGPLGQAGRAAPELLGTIHQHLLGRRLRLDCAGRHRVWTSTAAKKAGGVFYTPDYVIRYIVNRVLERMREPGSRSDRFLEGKILDPACGCGWFLLAACRLLAQNHRGWGHPGQGASAADPVKRIFGVDSDPQAVLASRRSLWLEVSGAEGAPAGPKLLDTLTRNICQGDAITDPLLDRQAGQFAAVIGNPPYHRELNGKALLERIGATDFGRRWRVPRMDLWYYFVHRGLELLQPGGQLSFIVGSYWTAGGGARKLIDDLRNSAHLDEIFLLGDVPLFPGVSGRHMILGVTKGRSDSPTLIKAPASEKADQAEPLVSGRAALVVFQKTPEQLFRDGRIDLQPPADGLLAQLGELPRLESVGSIRQGIAENPARVTRKAALEHDQPWRVGEGVFSLAHEELAKLQLPESERRLIRPYYHLCDLGRYYLAGEPSGVLIYSTSGTCPEVDRFPAIRDHLRRFRPIMDARRETRRGVRPWWQLHWPRQAGLWERPKLIIPQMAWRPSFAVASKPAYVPFSVNVFVPRPDTAEHLDYFAGVLNSRLIWKWYQHHAKRRGIGLDLSGHALRQTPIRRIDFSNPADVARHDRIVELVAQASSLSRSLGAKESRNGAALENEFRRADAQIDALVYDLHGLQEEEIAAVQSSTCTRK